jgi:hypothetical protein
MAKPSQVSEIICDVIEQDMTDDLFKHMKETAYNCGYEGKSLALVQAKVNASAVEWLKNEFERHAPSRGAAADVWRRVMRGVVWTDHVPELSSETISDEWKDGRNAKREEIKEDNQAKAIRIIWDLAKDKGDTDEEILDYALMGCPSLGYSHAKRELDQARAYHHPAVENPNAEQ